jgi:hypothetical protein
MYGIRIVIGMIGDGQFSAIQGKGQIKRDTAYIYNMNNTNESENFSAWRVLQVENGNKWIDYDGFSLDKVLSNEDGMGRNEEEEEECDEDCENCDNEDCENYGG